MDNQTNYPQEYFWNLLSKKLTSEATPEELVAFETILLQNPELQHQTDMLEQMWSQGLKKNTAENETVYMRHLMKYKDDFFHEHALSEQATNLALQPVYKDSSVKSILFNKRTITVSASIILILASWFIFFQEKKTPKKIIADNTSSVVTKNGNRTKIILPDGTQVWLNAGSKLDYNNLLFNKNLREVTLSGQAYFDVVKNPNKPFLVRTDNLQLKVLGTAFDVKSYPGDRESEASLIHGSIEVTVPGRPNEKYILKPHEKFIVKNTVSPIQKVQVKQQPDKPEVKEEELIVSIKKVNYLAEQNIIMETSWVDNKLLFDGDTFQELAIKMERWYDVKIEFKNEKIMNYRLKGAFMNESIEEALQALQLIATFRYNINGNEVVISKK